MPKVNFEEIEVVSEDGLVKVSLDWMGEGRDGDYDPDDPEDYPHLRFDVYRKYHEGDEVPPYCVDNDAYEHGEWMAVRDSSYCTNLNANNVRVFLIEAVKAILAQVESPVRDYQGIKKLCEHLSWIGTDRCKLN